MKKLYRASTAPNCLNNYCYKHNNWEHVSSQDRKEIRSHLKAMQGDRCAYCECEINSENSEKCHIDHFWKKSSYTSKTFDWDNLYMSCNREFSCGHYKESKKNQHRHSNPKELIDPCRENPDKYLQFYQGGEVEVRSGLSNNERQKANLTIKVFGLNCNNLRQCRKTAIKMGFDVFMKAKVEDNCPSRLKELNKQIVKYSENNPFSTALRHVFTERT